MADLLERIVNGICFVPSVLCLAILIVPMLVNAIIYIITWPFRLIESIFGGRRLNQRKKRFIVFLVLIRNN